MGYTYSMKLYRKYIPEMNNLKICKTGVSKHIKQVLNNLSHILKFQVWLILKMTKILRKAQMTPY